MSRREAAVAALALAVLIGGCAHSGAATAASRSGEREVAALRSCTNASCDELDAMLRGKLSVPLRARIVQVIAHGDDAIVARVTGRCRDGSDAVCGVLWWVLDRLYLDDDASPARANECPLSRAFFDATTERAATSAATL